PETARDPLAGTFAHVIVDEAQELTDAEWQMLLRRCPSRSFTIVGDRAQARNGFTESWQQRLTRLRFDTIHQARLNVNYRTPQEVMTAAEPVIKAVLPDANVPRSIRPGGAPVRYGSSADLPRVIEDWLATHASGTTCVIGDDSFRPTARVQSLTPVEAKGLEFDLVVLVDSAAFGDDLTGVVDRYVAMTRATQQLVILGSDRAGEPATRG
ncbi:MAG TPA: AAA family ATPase, partial [Propionibacteriaceae bacterium]|nr:AAA family ATPase [Propionibacteriaceae bacterium]